ncbi:hypothetical protein [Paraflavitalea speifideaquila]|uniref:hypothetical protein n=1 Tax=Paraflavitalea speifideaquila TaxID=3076558 RepID=UPI0028E5C53C|nr:hypothetical protein [Paraflavitalea speifideiaquila]
MTPLEQLQAIVNEQYITEDGEEYQVELKPPLSEQEIDSLASQLVEGHLPAEIRELLQFAGGFQFNMMEVTFDRYDYFGMDNICHHSIELAGDGLGNCWVLDIDNKGKWGNVFLLATIRQ